MHRSNESAGLALARDVLLGHRMRTRGQLLEHASDDFEADRGEETGRTPGKRTLTGDLRARDGVVAELGARMGADVSGVRFHTDGAAADRAKAEGARAFTVGNDVYFGAGYYDPGSTAGQKLIAHELAHTVQQSRSGEAGVARKAVYAGAQDAAEVEADRVAELVVAGQTAEVSAAPTPGALHRKFNPAGICQNVLDSVTGADLFQAHAGVNAGLSVSGKASAAEMSAYQTALRKAAEGIRAYATLYKDDTYALNDLAADFQGLSIWFGPYPATAAEIMPRIKQFRDSYFSNVSRLLTTVIPRLGSDKERMQYTADWIELVNTVNADTDFAAAPAPPAPAPAPAPGEGPAGGAPGQGEQKDTLFPEKWLAIKDKVREWKEHIEKVQEALDKGGKLVPELVKSAVDKAAQIADALNKVGDKMQVVEEVYQLAAAAKRFYSSIQGLDINNPETAKAFGQAAQDLGNAAQPFVDKLTSFLDKAVKAGESWAAQGTIVLGYLQFMSKMFVEGVQAGMKVIAAYRAHQRDAYRKVDECYDRGSIQPRPCRDDENPF
jgi:hypothetical protein